MTVLPVSSNWFLEGLTLKAKPTIVWAAWLIVTLYVMCSVCPDRLVSFAIGRQPLAVAAAAMDCDQEEHHTSEKACQELPHQYLLARSAQLDHDLSAQGVSLPFQNHSMVVRWSVLAAAAYRSGSDPPLGLRVTKLRI